MKKLFPEKDVAKKGVVSFLDRKGFYIILILCIAIVGATAVFVTTHNISSVNTKSDADKIIPEEAAENSALAKGNKTAMQSSISTSPGKTDQKVAAKTESASKNAAANANSKQTTTQNKNANAPAANSANQGTNAVKPANTAKVQQFVMPVFGEVTTVFAQSNLVYSKTLEEWRTHSGTDIAAERGTPVKSVADGVVSEIKNDPRLGITVIIEHPNGIKTVYANLAGDDMVSVNQKVKQNDIIGCVGNTASFEIAEQSHLHFEVWKNNEPTNPSAYLPKKD